MSTITAGRIAAALGLPEPTDEQTRVIEHPPGPLLVVAGAGSGKTETMAARVVWLVANGHVAADQVLGLTFTRKAAAELGRRISVRLQRLRSTGLVEPAGDVETIAAPTVSTYHAYAGRLVREHGLRLGIEPDSRLLSEAAAWQLAHEVVTAYDGPLEQVGRTEPTITRAVVALSGEMAEHLVGADALADWHERILGRIDAITTADKETAGRSRPAPAAGGPTGADPGAAPVRRGEAAAFGPRLRRSDVPRRPPGAAVPGGGRPGAGPLWRGPPR